MGSAKLQICSIQYKEQDFTLYAYSMLYLEKLFTQTIYDHDAYNTMNNVLYLPQVRERARKLTLNLIGIEKCKRYN